MSSKLKGIAGLLYEAERKIMPVDPISNTCEKLTTEECYAIQEINANRKCLAGDFVTGYKIGLTSESAMQQYHTNEPAYGYLLESMKVTDDSVLKLDELIQPKLECEVAFCMNGNDFWENMTLDEFKRNIKFICASYEIVDSRIRNWEVNTLADMIADNGCAGMYYLGERSLSVDALQLDAINVVLSVDGECMRTGSSSIVYGSPLKAVYWLAKKLYLRGIQLKEDQVVLSGTATSTIVLDKGKTYTTGFNGLGTVSLKYC